ncbi:MAG: hypothetical protein WCL38_04540 [Actinomycetota bacterium]
MNESIGEVPPPPPPPPPPAPPLPSPKTSRRKTLGIAALFFGLGGLLLAIVPIAVAWIGSARAGGSMWDESGSGAVLWMLFFTIPVGGVSAIGGLVCWISWSRLRDKG